MAQRGLTSQSGPDELAEVERLAFHREFTAKFHELLDAGHGECVLSRQDIASILVESLTSGHEEFYQLDGWVVMPNHFHALVEPMEKHTLGSILQWWKGASARRINQALGRAGSLWQAETFDHIIRSEEQLLHFRRYIARNPEKAGLRQGFVLGQGKTIPKT